MWEEAAPGCRSKTFAGQGFGQGLQDGQAADAGIEDADGQIVNGHVSQRPPAAADRSDGPALPDRKTHV